MIKNILTVFIISFAFQLYSQGTPSTYKDATPLLKTYFQDTAVHNRLKKFYRNLETCRDPKTVDWLITEQAKLCRLLTSSFDLGFDPGTDKTRSTAYETYQKLNTALPSFSFHEGVGDFATVVHANFTPILEASQLNQSSIDDQGLKIIIDAWGTTRFDYPNYSVLVCCDCPGQSELGSGLHSKLLIAIEGFKLDSDLFTEALEEIRLGVKQDVLYNARFTRSKQAILTELQYIGPLLKLTEAETIVYKNKKVFVEEATEDELHALGG